MKISSRQAILAAMAGITDSSFGSEIYNIGYVGKLTLGGYPIGKSMIIASKSAVNRGRTEFILQENLEAVYISKELEKLPSEADIIINLRINDPEETKRFINHLSSIVFSKPIIEINAHCQQIEFMKKGGGQYLLKRLPVLEKIIMIIQRSDFCTSLKIRGNAVIPRKFIQIVNKWNLDYLHIDSYTRGKEGADLTLLKEFVSHSNVSIIGNNSVVCADSAKAILQTGAEFFSVARAARKDKSIFKAIINHY